MPARPLVLAHRGASAYAPENTFASFDLALQMGARAMETDVRATSDGHLVLLHDERLERTTSGTGPVAQTPLQGLLAADAGAWKGPVFAGQRVPTLQAYLQRYGQHVFTRVEVKAAAIEAQLLEEVERAGAQERVEFSSFTWAAVERLCGLARRARTGWLVQEVTSEVVSRAAAVGARFLSGRADALTPEAVERGRAAGLEVGAWGVQDDALLARVVELGVDAFTCNWPDRALRAVAALPE